VVRDNSIYIRNAVADVIDELMLGALLTVIIVMLFLNDWKAPSSPGFPSRLGDLVVHPHECAGLHAQHADADGALPLDRHPDRDAIVVIENIVRHGS